MKETLKVKIAQFIESATKPRVVVYENGIPTGVAKTKGFGNPGEIRVLLVDAATFKTRRSPHVELAGAWQVRRDYGTIKGHCAQCRNEAEDLAMEWGNKLDLNMHNLTNT